MAINYASFQVQAPRTNQQGLIAAAQGMERRADRHRYGIAQGADIALNSLQQQKQLQKQYDEAVASGNNQAAQGIGQQLDGLMAAQNNFLQGHERKELRGIAAIADPYEREMALKQAMAYSPDYLQQRQARMSSASSKGFAPVEVQVPVLDKQGNQVVVNGQPQFRTELRGISHNPNTDQYSVQNIDLGGDILAFEEEKARARGYGGQAGREEAELAYYKQKAQEEAEKVAELERIKSEQAVKQKEQEKLVESRQNIIDKERDLYDTSQATANKLAELEAAMMNAETGKYSQLKAWAGKYIPAFEDTDDMQYLQSLTTSFALAELAKQSGTKTDLDFLKSAEATIQAGNYKKANEMILERMKREQAYGRERYDKFREYRKNSKEVENFDFTPDQSEAYKDIYEAINQPQTTQPITQQPQSIDFSGASNEDLLRGF